jgi:phenylalanyl-tRNA synthetase alpha chain
MVDEVNKLIDEAENFLIETSDQLESFRLRFLVKKGAVNKLFQEFKNLPKEQKRDVGKPLNIAKQKIESIFQTAKEKLEESQDDAKKELLPGYFTELGSRHPISAVIDDMTTIFERLGFNVSTGPEIEDDWHNFTALNFPQNHPARDMQDTFFVDKDIALRTHTSSVQVRIMEKGVLPIRSIMPGRVYRNEAISARSNCFFIK